MKKRKQQKIKNIYKNTKTKQKQTKIKKTKTNKRQTIKNTNQITALPLSLER